MVTVAQILARRARVEAIAAGDSPTCEFCGQAAVFTHRPQNQNAPWALDCPCGRGLPVVGADPEVIRRTRNLLLAGLTPTPSRVRPMPVLMVQKLEGV